MNVIVTGPAGCGKSADAEKLRVLFGLDRVFDTEPATVEDLSALVAENDYCLILTQIPASELVVRPSPFGNTPIWLYDEAVAWMNKISPAQNPET